MLGRYKMNPQDVISIGNQLLADYGLFEKGWTFHLNSNKRRLGVCRYNSKRIEISIFLCLFKTDKEVMDTLKHELAHAIVGYSAGHGPIWREKAIELGCSGNRCGEAFITKGKFELTCKNCDKRFYRHKRPARSKIAWCPKCGRDAGTYKFEDWKEWGNE